MASPRPSPGRRGMRRPPRRRLGERHGRCRGCTPSRGEVLQHHLDSARVPGLVPREHALVLHVRLRAGRALEVENRTMTTAAPWASTGTSIRRWDSQYRTNSLVRLGAEACPLAAGSAAPPRGKNAMAAVAPRMNTSISARAAGLTRAALASRRRRRGIVSMGYDVLVPETMKIPATAMYVTTPRGRRLDQHEGGVCHVEHEPRPAVDSRKM